ncbi:hypothetical protein [Niabella soli]|uniref:Uncharacterized protein n=1 Tax=Niabella soli DSM 19437 TaxID=929713 RepID=W0F363_9BACT|nr:hypothetical protein [Niabella soli]AHF17472.1 hypothetical protein NIASO_08270 [Niabella soli DSM 19437]
MKQKFLFMLPRLAVLAALVGLASFVLFLVFRLLILVIAIGVIVFIAGKIISKARTKWMMNNGMPLDQPAYYHSLDGATALQPVFGKEQRSGIAIIPIN